MDKPAEKDYNKLSKEDVKKHGRVFHLLKTVEECNELSTAIIQHITKGDPVQPILQEIGDIEMCCNNIRNIYGNKLIDKLKDEKWFKRDDKLDDTPTEPDKIVERIEEINEGR